MVRIATEGAPHARVAPAPHDLAAGLLVGLTVSAALAVALAIHTTSRPTIVATGAVAGGIIALGWSLGRWLNARSVAGGRGSQRLRAERPTHPPGGRLVRWTTWLRSVMGDQEHGDGVATPARARHVALTAGAGWLGSLLPLVPYLWPLPAPAAVLLSATVTAGALGTLGAVTAHAAGLAPRVSAMQALATGTGLSVISAVLILLARLTTEG